MPRKTKPKITDSVVETPPQETPNSTVELPPTPVTEISDTSLESHAERHKPRILPANIKIVHDGRNASPNFEMGEDFAYRRRVIGFREDPGPEVKTRLTTPRKMSDDGKPVNFQYDETKKLWHTPATPDGRALSEAVANEISGKDVRYGFGRG